ncbi:hypothetical protein [Pseudophaeobacter sp. A-200-2]|uniref:hypothetical protein n=1 Tax=Pseudophaeobacter sp. A-200-2 TaxID=3098145 RepID=UPI0034D486C4
MQFPASYLINVKFFDVEAMKAQQPPPSDALLQLKERYEARAEAKTPEISQASQIAEGYDRMIKIAESLGGSIGGVDVEKLKAGKEVSVQEARFADENGFNLQVNSRSVSTYKSVQADGANPVNFSSKEEALQYASRTLSALQRFAEAINTYGNGDPTVGGEYSGTNFEPVEGYDEFNAHMKMQEARTQDNLEASRMRLVVESEILSATFGIDEPIFEIKDGQVGIRSFDMTYRGETIAHSAGGNMAEYSENGTLKMDKKV